MFPQLFTLAVRSSNHSLVRFILSEISEAKGTCSVQLGLPEALEAQSGQCSGSKPSSGDDSGVPPETVDPLSSSVSDKSEVLDLGFLSKLHGDHYTSHFHEIPNSSHGCHFRDQRRQQCSHHPRGSESHSIGCHQRGLVNMVDNYNHTSLFYAVENNDLEMAEILILNGACVNMWDPRTGQSPLMVALENHNGAMLSLIMDNGGDPLRISPISGQDVMDLAIQKNDGKIIERIVNHVNYDINTSYNDIGSIILEYATFQDKSDLKLIGKAFKKQLNREYFFKQLKDYEKEARHVLDIVKIRISDALLSRLLKMESKKKVAIICQVTDEDGRGTLWWSAYYGNIKQIQHLLYFYSKAIRNRWDPKEAHNRHASVQRPPDERPSDPADPHQVQAASQGPQEHYPHPKGELQHLLLLYQHLVQRSQRDRPDLLCTAEEAAHERHLLPPGAGRQVLRGEYRKHLALEEESEQLCSDLEECEECGHFVNAFAT
ncbi:ankyrin repeat-containing protein [Cryptosporidium canis]|uniref:Ankyrin repeat-containing protein n=1 Tax=Cryptosporidium canis TaxID=195482 RepID=A0A9D5DG75_9CRYT|nr:ankyrin repeat-containing protein [Cryptosporidium canis]